jgi:carbamoyl-phosphate synthase small subunit
MQAILALEDGRVFRGKGYGAKGECYGEFVFKTSLLYTKPSQRNRS